MENEKSSMCSVGLSVQVELPKGATANIKITSKEEQFLPINKTNNTTPPPLFFSYYNEDFYLRYIN